MINFLIKHGKVKKKITLDVDNLKWFKIQIQQLFNLKTLEFFIIANNSCLVNNTYLKKLNDKSDNKFINLEINFRLKGGVIDAIIDLLAGIVKMLVGVVKIIVQFLEMLAYVFEMIPVVFDPPRLVNDILFAVTTSITTILDRAMNSVDVESPEDDDKEDIGPMGVNKRIDKKVCLPPTMTQILFLMLCPPLAIFFKYDFMRAIIPSIICGVLCVKFYYFPGLLFASLMTLC